MKDNLQPYYCYINQGIPVILETKPENFKDLPRNFIACCPSPEIAEKAYKCNLKIESWRTQS